MSTSTWKRVTAATVIGVVGVAGIGSSASATPTASPSQIAVTASTVSLTTTDWQAVARAAGAQGDTAAATAAGQMAARSAGSPGVVQPQAWGMIVKNAIKAALKYGKQYLPAKIRPYADRLYNLIDEIEGMAEVPIFTALVNAGIPPDVARATAQWIVTFL